MSTTTLEPQMEMPVMNGTSYASHIKNVTVIGAGTMGNGICHVFAQCGYTSKYDGCIARYNESEP
jgi:hypothetical protein